MNPSDFASLSSGQVLLPDTSQAEAGLGQLVRPVQLPKQPELAGQRVAAAEREDVNQKLVSALIIPTTTAVRAPVITLNGERANVYGIVERHLRPETLAGPDRFWKSAKTLYNLDTWRPRWASVISQALALAGPLPSTSLTTSRIDLCFVLSAAALNCQYHVLVGFANFYTAGQAC